VGVFGLDKSYQEVVPRIQQHKGALHMQRFFTGRLDGQQNSGKPLNSIGEVDLGETFVIEHTIIPDETEREQLGPLRVKGVKPGDIVAIHIKDVRISKNWGIEPNYAFIPEVVDQMLTEESDMGIETPLRESELQLPGGVSLPLCPMVGTISLAALHSCPNPWANGGNMDIKEIRKGSTLYIRAQRDGGLLAIGDLHAYQGDGELAGSAAEANGDVELCIGVTDVITAPRPVIQVEGRTMTVGFGLTYWTAVQSAVRDMAYLLSKVYELPIVQAYTIAVQGGNLRNGAIWMMNDHPYVTMQSYQHRMPRTVFLDIPISLSSSVAYAYRPGRTK